MVVEKLQIENEKCVKKKGLNGDYGNICLLLLLYTLQGLPLGLILSTVPMILASNNVGYNKQAILSFARYPYVFKLLWAPIVDAVYSRKFGRRKSWLVPAQYCIGISMIVLSHYGESLIGSKNVAPNISLLTISLFSIVFLVATQDVAVDAWALTLLSKHNVHYAASCNAVGVVFGHFISNTIFLSLNSAEFCNKWLRNVRQDTGMVSFDQFMFIIGCTFIISTTFIWIFKREKDVESENGDIKSILTTYSSLWDLLHLKSIQVLALVQITQNIGHAIIDMVVDLKLIQFGVKRENVSLLKVPISILNLFLPFISAKQSKKNPLTFYWNANISRLICGCFLALIVYWTQTMNKPEAGFPAYFYVCLFGAFLIYDILKVSMGMSMWAFKTRIADPNIGATYITLLTTLYQIGNKWTSTLSLWLVDVLTIKFKSTSTNLVNETSLLNFSLSNLSATNLTYSPNNSSQLLGSTIDRPIVIDGFYVEFIICFIIGLVWLKLFRAPLLYMQALPESEWRFCKQESTKM